MTPIEKIPAWATAELEALYRLETVRLVIDAIAIGSWDLTPEIGTELARLVDQATRWAEIAAALGLAA